jgi:hypothetical protein
MGKQKYNPGGNGWLLYLAAWGVSSVMIGVLIGRHLRQVSSYYPPAEPSLIPDAETVRKLQA